jgi:hypothetical protein
MENTTVPVQEPSRGAAFEDAWTMFKETERLIKEMGLETDRRMQETDRRMQETDRRMQETDRQMQETDRRMQETDRKIGKLSGRLGEIIEHLMSPKLHEKFEDLGYRFNHTSRNHEIKGADKKRLTEVDILLENGDYALAVEVKTRLSTEDVKDHVKRMEILRRVADDHGDGRKYLGAVAGAVIDGEVSAYALRNGFFVIIPSGETVDIETPEGFKPRIW